MTATRAWTDPLRAVPALQDWVLTMVGILDSSYGLTAQEKDFCIAAFTSLFTDLGIPHREDPTELPVPVLHQVNHKVYTRRLLAPGHDKGRAVYNLPVSVQAWTEALLRMILTSYRLTPEETIHAAQRISRILDFIGVPDRQAAHYPDDVVRSALEVDGPS